MSAAPGLRGGRDVMMARLARGRTMDISELLTRVRAALAAPDNDTHRRELAASLKRAASDPRVSRPQQDEAAALAVRLVSGLD
jgi:hypothetical protein